MTSYKGELFYLDPKVDEDMRWLAAAIAKGGEGYLTDVALNNPLAWFLATFGNPNNMAFRVHDDGFIAFIDTVPGWKTDLIVAAWGPTAMRRDDLWRAAGEIMMRTHDLLVIHGFAWPDNTLSKRLMKRAGMTYEGRIKNGAWYNGKAKDLDWFRIHRRDLLTDED